MNRFTPLLLFLILMPLHGEALHISTGYIPPYVSDQEDEDFVLDLLDAVAEKMGISFLYESAPWARTEVQVQSHSSWGAVPYVRNPEREKIYLFSDPLYESTIYFYYYKGSGDLKRISYRRLSDLEGYHLSGVRGYYYQEELEKSGLNVSFVTDELQNLKLLISGRVDLIIMNSTVARYMIREFFQKEDPADFGTLAGEYKTHSIHLMVDKDYPGGKEILERFNRSLENIKNSPLYEKLKEEHGIE